MKTRSMLRVPALLAPALLGCTIQPPRAPEGAAPPASVAAELLQPPPPGDAPSVSFPHIQHRRLDSGLPLYVIERHTHPLLELRLVIRSGSATDGAKPGLASLAAEMLGAGGAGRFGPLELLKRVESLGTNLEIRTGPDATTIALDVTAPLLDEALEILSAVALQPAFRPRELDLLRDREIERVNSAARGDPDWSATRVLFWQLYAPQGGPHPYARYDALPAQLARITLSDCRRWYRQHVVPSNASLIIVGDVTPDAGLASAAKWFRGFGGGSAPEPNIPRPLGATTARAFVMDRPGSAQARIYVGVLGPERQSRDWAALTVANQILGGGVSGRLFRDVREQRSLAYTTSSSIREVAVGPVALILSAGTRSREVPRTVRALLDHMALISQQAPAPDELGGAKAFLTDGFLLKLETVDSVAELVRDIEILGLPDDYYDRYRTAVRDLALGEVATVAGKYYDRSPVVVVSGDAAAFRAPLEAIAPVTLLEPGHDFEPELGR